MGLRFLCLTEMNLVRHIFRISLTLAAKGRKLSAISLRLSLMVLISRLDSCAVREDVREVGVGERADRE